MTLLSGVLGTSLAIERDKNGILSVTGDTNVTKLHTIDNDLRKDFIKWNDLRVSGIEYRSQPAKLRIKSIDTRELYARVIIAANQVLNITEVLTPPSAHSAAAHASNSEPPPQAPPDASEQPRPPKSGAKQQAVAKADASEARKPAAGGESMAMSIGTRACRERLGPLRRLSPSNPTTPWPSRGSTARSRACRPTRPRGPK